MGGLTAYHIRVLVESEWNGGGGYTLEDVGNMTLDQIWFRLCDANMLKREIGKRTEKREPMAVSPSGDDGLVAGVVDGEVRRLPIKGKSLARRLMEEEEARLKKEREGKGRMSRRERRRREKEARKEGK